MDTTGESKHSQPGHARRLGGLLLGLLVLLAMLRSAPPPHLPPAGWTVAAVALLMAIWWVTEAAPVYVTALVPLALFPLLGVAPMKDVAEPYANPLIFLFMGGFMIAQAMQRWDLHRRVALVTVGLTGTRARGLIGGFMAASAFLSMWVSNTATAVMMLPIAASVTALLNGDGGRSSRPAGEFDTALFLGIAYGCSIGGVATLIGTPPNALLAAFFSDRLGIHIGFSQWMAAGLPLSIVMLWLAWLLLTRIVYRIGNQPVAGAEALVREQLTALGPPSRGEVLTGLAFLCAALLWMLRPLLADLIPQLHVSDAGIAMGVAITLFIVPVNLKRGVFLLDWAWASCLPWGVLLLVGGGLSLADAMSVSGLAGWLGHGLGAISHWPLWLVLVSAVALIKLLSELTSNTATTAAFLPILVALAARMEVTPLFLAAPATVAASCAFMMPVATPPNAIVFATGRVTVPQMARAGALLSLLAIALVSAFAYLVFPLVLGGAGTAVQ